MGFGGLYTSISGLQASKGSLNTVGHNITNANNPNYVRQSAIHGTNPYRQTGKEGMEVGTGVNIVQIRQIRDEFLDRQIRRELPSFGYFYAKAETLADVEGVFNEITNSGLQKVMGDFWKSWDELYKEPESLTTRGIVHESAVAFTETVNHLSGQLNDIQGNLNKQILNKVGEVNNLLDKIGGLNRSIKLVEGESNKMKANDYRDERNGIIDKLTQLLPVDTFENRYGETIVSLQGQDLLSGNYISKIDIQTDSRGLGKIYWERSSEEIILGDKGELGGLIDVRDSSVEEYKDRLDSLVREMAEAINHVHEKGYGLGEGPPKEEGNKRPFFTGIGEVITAGNIKLNTDLSDLNKIAASGSGARGDGDIAREIGRIRDKSDLLTNFKDPTKTMKIDDYYNDLVTSLALEREASRSKAENQGFLIMSIDEKRMGLSSVSLDEEMADMIKFQHAYAANSRVINTLDEMIDTIVNRLGLVGR